MAKQHLTDAIVRRLPAPATGNKITVDATTPGFGVRVTAAGAQAFVLNYRTRAGRQRRWTIGSFPDWSVSAAREEARRLKREIRTNGADPVGEIETERGAPTVASLIERYTEEQMPKLRPATQREYRSIISKWIAPAMASMKVEAVSFRDVDRLHAKITKAGKLTRANRTVAVLGRMMAFAIKWRWRPDNPCLGIEKNQEQSRERFLTRQEIDRLMKALAKYQDQAAANVIRLLLLTGARLGETLQARWQNFDLETGIWTKPAATTKQKADHRIPLAAPARQLLSGMREGSDGEFLFPGKSNGHRHGVRHAWDAVTEAADLHGVRLHDLRHTFASYGISSGLSLYTVGALLGHTQSATTERYAHLMEDPLREAAERTGAIIAGSKPAEVIPMPKRRRK